MPRCFVRSLIGNPVRIGSGPAAVIGDKSRNMPLPEINPVGRRGMRMIREPENLPWQENAFPLRVTGHGNMAKGQANWVQPFKRFLA